MSQNVLSAEPREGKGKGPARRLRRSGKIPAVVYGSKGEPKHLSVDPEALLEAIETPRKFNTLLTLKVGGGEAFVLFKDYQVDPVSRKLLHADFLEVKLDQPVKVEVPVAITGKAVGTTEGGIL
jgi:large subunit ribosomal protein L25